MRYGDQPTPFDAPDQGAWDLYDPEPGGGCEGDPDGEGCGEARMSSSGSLGDIPVVLLTLGFLAFCVITLKIFLGDFIGIVMTLEGA